MLQIKKQYQGLIITRNTLAAGSITLDTNIIKEAHYKNFSDLGFDDVFEELVEEEVFLTDEEELEDDTTPEDSPIIITEEEIKTEIKKRGRKKTNKKIN